MSSFLGGFSWHLRGDDNWNEKKEVKVTLHQRYRRVIASIIITVWTGHSLVEPNYERPNRERNYSGP